MPIILSVSSLLFPLATIPFILGFYSKTHKVLPCALALGVAFGSAAVSMEVIAQGDLYRYISATASYKDEPIEYIFTSKYSDSLLAALFFWLVANSIGPEALPFFVGMIVYGSLSYIILDFAKSEYLSATATCAAIVGMIFVTSFYGSVSSVRSSLAMCIGLGAIYRDAYKGKINFFTILLYIIPCYVHSAGFCILAVRILGTLFKSHPIAAGIISGVSLPILMQLSSYIASIVPILGNIMNTIIDYSTWTDTGWAAEVASSPFQRVLRLANCFLIALLAIGCAIFLRRKNPETGRVDMFVRIILIGLCMTFGIAIFITSDVYLRFAYFFESLGILIFVSKTSYLLNGKASRNIIYLIAILIIVISIMLVALYMFQIRATVDIPSLLCAFLFGILSM